MQRRRRLSRAVPPTGVYLVSPASSAALAAAITCGGVAKSGSPTESEMMSRPSARSVVARSVIAVVCDGAMRASAAEVVAHASSLRRASARAAHCR